MQLLAFPLNLVLLYLLARAQLAPGWLTAALLQGVLAALLSWRCRLAPWWRPMQLLFPPALLAGLSLALPPLVFLGGFVLLLGWYWSTFRTQVPFYPSGRRAWDAVAQLLPERPLQVIDIGSGLGGLVLDLARRRPDSVVSGIELAPLPWLLSALRGRLSGSPARFTRGDYERLDFARYDVVFAYLSPAVMDRLWSKAQNEMRSGSMLVSYEFNIAAKTADQTIAATSVGPALYVWYF
ncbi:MAG: class I SAM-dependent methyltransferase [Pseudomonadota bacterium]